MEGVEEIPGIVLADGMNWEWESFPEYLDALERRPRAIDIAAQLAHLPLRVYVMGDRAVRREAGDAGRHRRDAPAHHRGARRPAPSASPPRAPIPTRRRTAIMVPSRDAEADELVGIGSALGAVGAGAFGMNSDFDDEDDELAWMTQARPARPAVRSGSCSPTATRIRSAGGGCSRPRTRRAPRGLHLTAQIAGRPIGVMLGIGTALNPFSMRPSYQARLERLPHRGAAPAAARSANCGARILAERPSDGRGGKAARSSVRPITSRWDKFFVMGNPPDYEPAPREERRRHRGARRPHARRGGLRLHAPRPKASISIFPVVNYTVRRSRRRSAKCSTIRPCLLGLSDGGAHCTSIVDAGVPTFMLMHWGRDRSRGPRLPLELLVKRQTSETADFFGLSDRGRLAPGLRADVNVIDFEALTVQKPELVHDHAGQRPPFRAAGRRL